MDEREKLKMIIELLEDDKVKQALDILRDLLNQSSSEK
jgi:hypothetical protein